MDKLPATSYVRMVDIWLIFVQLYPFVEGATFCRFKLLRIFSISNSSKNVLNEYILIYKSDLKVVLYTIIEMYVVEENTNNHGFRRFVPEPKMEEKVRIYILKQYHFYIII